MRLVGLVFSFMVSGLILNSFYTNVHAHNFYQNQDSIFFTLVTSSNCDPSYPDVCIPSPPPDLNCGDIPQKRFTVTGSDPHGFDRDGDGIGCES
jgi:hypothetical protein